MKKKSVSLLFFLLFGATAAIMAIPSGRLMVIAWGENAPDWNQALHLSGTRIGCSSTPASCIQEVDRIAATQHVSSVFLAILLNPANVATNAATYGNLALSHPNLAEVGFDDFVSQCEKTHLGPGELSSLLETVASNLKSRSSRVKFGATIYQDQLITGGTRSAPTQRRGSAKHRPGSPFPALS